MNSTFFSNNRQKFSQLLNGGVAVLATYTQTQSQGDMSSKFLPETNFWYLTGIESSDWKLVINSSTGEEWLIAPEAKGVSEVFDGVLSFDRASEISGIKQVIAHKEGENLLQKLAKEHAAVFTVDSPPYADHFNFALNPAVTNNKRMLEKIFTSVVDCQRQLAKLRAIKQPEEIDAIKAAIDLTIKGFNIVKEKIKSTSFEYELEAEFSYLFKRSGGYDHAYSPIIAAGKNACTLHYDDNSERLLSSQLLLMDVGARVNGYAADITRTYAGKEGATARQREIHDAVEAAHHDIIKLLKPGLLVEEYASRVDRRMKTALKDVGLIKDENDVEKYRKYFPHAISHGLGIDVHDSLGGPKHFEQGMVLTVEPGIYIPKEGIGVRIEDDILITDSGSTNLSAALSTGL